MAFRVRFTCRHRFLVLCASLLRLGLFVEDETDVVVALRELHTEELCGLTLVVLIHALLEGCQCGVHLPVVLQVQAAKVKVGLDIVLINREGLLV